MSLQGDRRQIANLLSRVLALVPAGRALVASGESSPPDRRGRRTCGALEVDAIARRAARRGLRGPLSRARDDHAARCSKYPSLCSRELSQARAGDAAVVFEGPVRVEHRWAASRAFGVAASRWMDSRKALFAPISDRRVSPRRASSRKAYGVSASMPVAMRKRDTMLYPAMVPMSSTA